jgi:hypothetical protein
MKMIINIPVVPGKTRSRSIRELNSGWCRRVTCDTVCANSVGLFQSPDNLSVDRPCELIWLPVDLRAETLVTAS